MKKSKKIVGSIFLLVLALVFLGVAFLLKEQNALYYDLNKDGATEQIIVDISDQATVSIMLENGEHLWTQSIPNYNDKEYFLLYTNDEAYAMLHYVMKNQKPEFYDWKYELFHWNTNGDIQIKKQDSLSIKLSADNFMLDSEESAGFYFDINNLLDKSMLLVGIENGKFISYHDTKMATENFSWMNDYKEAFQENDSIVEKLNKINAFITLKHAKAYTNFLDKDGLWQKLNEVKQSDLEHSTDIVKLAALPKNKISLYGLQYKKYPDYGVIIQKDKQVAVFDWEYCSQYDELPSIKWYPDQACLAVVCPSIPSKLHLVYQDVEDNLYEKFHNLQQELAEIDKLFSWQFADSSDEVVVFLQDKKVFILDISEIRSEKIDSVRVFYSNEKYQLADQIIITSRVVVNIADWASPYYTSTSVKLTLPPTKNGQFHINPDNIEFD